MSAAAGWQRRAACRAEDPEAFFPEWDSAARAAQAVCAGCPVRAQCLELSLRHWDIGQHGVWGGLIATDRAYLRRRRPAIKTLSTTGPRLSALADAHRREANIAWMA